MPVPPAAVRRAAARGLRLRGRFGRGGTAVGLARARDLSAGRNVSDKTVKRMRSYFARHAVDAKAKGSAARGYWGNDRNPSAGWIAWLLWGGDAGRRWARGQQVEEQAMARRQRNAKWTTAECEKALDDEAVRAEADTMGYQDYTSEIEGSMEFEQGLRDFEEWFQETVVQAFMDQHMTAEIEELYDEPPDDPFEDVMVAVDVVAGSGGYLPAGAPSYEKKAGDFLVAEGAYEGEPEVSLPTDDAEFMRTAVRASLVDGMDDKTVPWLVHVMWTAYVPEEAEENPGDVDEHAVSMLENFVSSDGALYPLRQSIERKLIKKYRKGTFDRALADRAYMPLMEAGAKKFVKEEEDYRGRRWHDVFPKDVRRAVAEIFADHFEAEAALGNMDYLLTRKANRGRRRR